MPIFNIGKKLKNLYKKYHKVFGEARKGSYIYGINKKIKVMKKMLNYINNNLIEFIAIRDSILFVIMIYIGWLGVKFILLNIA